MVRSTNGQSKVIRGRRQTGISAELPVFYLAALDARKNNESIDFSDLAW